MEVFTLNDGPEVCINIHQGLRDEGEEHHRDANK